MGAEKVRLNRTAGDTLRWYLTTRASRLASTLTAVALVAALGVWQYPNASALVQDWAAGLSGKDATLTAQAAFTSAYAAAQATAGNVTGDLVDASALVQALADCEGTQATADVAVMDDCTSRLNAATAAVGGDLDRYAVAVQVAALVQQSADAKAQREEEAKAAAAAQAEKDRLAAEKEALEAQRRAAEEEARRLEEEQQNNGGTGGESQPSQPQPEPQQPSQPQPQPPTQPQPPVERGSTLTETITCKSRQTVTASASGGGTVTVSITGAGTASNSGSGSASASATGSGTFTIVATSTSGGLSLNPSWTGNCW